MRVIVLAPTPYKISVHSRLNYREPAYLLSTDTETASRILIQICFDRWQIEVNNRDEKSILRVGDAQVHAEKSVPRQPAFAVATYSMLLLSGLITFGPGRTDDYVKLPAWRKNAKRPSCLDLLSLLRSDLNETSISELVNTRISENAYIYAYT